MSNEKMNEISELIDSGEFAIANEKTEKFLNYAFSINDRVKKGAYIFNISGFFIDIGHYWQKIDICKKGLDLLIEYESEILLYVPKSHYFYDLGNGKSNMISFIHGDKLDFNNIEEVIELKNIYWKAFKENKKEQEENLQLKVNLANSLKRQFRLSESLRYYDEVVFSDNGIFQAHVNRSETLKILNNISDTYSAKMIHEIIKGYSKAIKSKKLPSQFIEYYKNEEKRNQNILLSLGVTFDELDKEETEEEFEALSEYRKYCIRKKLTLSEHGLYCACSGAARDNLTIPLLHKSIGGDFVPKTETVLNRIKSEFSLARSNYYDYFNTADETEKIYEDCYTDLLNDEILGISIEKLRTSFRICFGILDKIALAICDLYSIGNKGSIYFHSFWRLNQNENRRKYNEIKNPGLLALYSISSDLNEHKDGEWACFKEWRNALEHGMFIIYKGNTESLDPYNSLDFKDNIVKVNIDDFLCFIDELLQLTRSAIFSFVFCVRAYTSEQNDKGINIKLNRKDE